MVKEPGVSSFGLVLLLAAKVRQGFLFPWRCIPPGASV
jgi:hypothetical protein